MSIFKFKNLLDAIKYLKSNKETVKKTEKIEVEGMEMDLYYDHENESFSICTEEEIEEEVQNFDDVTNDIYHNSISFAHKIYNAFKTSDVVIAKAPMQFGKTSTIHYLANGLFAKDFKKGETMLFLTSMSDTALFLQNKGALEDKKFFKNGKWHKSITYVVKMVPDFKLNPLKYLQQNNVKVVGFDECDYGSGKNSVFNNSLFKLISDNNLDIKLLLISATPYCAINAVLTNELKAEIVVAEKPDNYFGVKKMLETGLVRDINNYYNTDENCVRYRLMSSWNTLTNEFKSDLDSFANKDGGGLCLIRAENGKNAKNLKQLIELNSDKYEVIVVGVKHQPIKSVLGNDSFSWEHSIKYENKKIVLIVINALSAGKDLGDLKKHVRLVIETRTRMVANGSQGLVGRICGYHDNRDIKIIASKDILEANVRIEDDYTILSDNDFINDCVSLKLDFSTQLKKASKSKITISYETSISDVFSFDDVENKKPELIDLFSDEKYGTFDELVPIINGKRTKHKSPINTQRQAKYVNHPEIFDEIWDECENKTISFASRFHRFRAEAGDERRLRIKRGLIINDKTRQFYVIDRIDNGTEILKNAETKNSSCYIKNKRRK